MKKFLLSTIVLFAAVTFSKAQIQVTAYTGYQFGSSTNVYGWNTQGRFKIKAGQDFGGMLSFEVRPGTQAEFSYTFMGTYATIERGGFPANTLGDVDVHYYQIGGVQETTVGENVDLFGTLTVGGTTFSPKTDYVTIDDRRYSVNSKTYFSVGVGGGVKLWLSDVIGIRLQARMLMPVTWGGFYFGTGGGGATVGSSIISGDVGGGLVFKIGG
jgi:hypothetical protein